MLNYCAIIPARNEAERIGRTLNALNSRSELTSIIVVDDASTDRTSAIAEAAGATVVRLARRAGKGGALVEGIKSAPKDAQAFLFLDADLGDSATEFVKLIVPLEHSVADMTIGKLPPDPELVALGQTGGGLGIVVGLARSGIKRKTGLDLEQPLSGQRAIRREVIEAIGSSFAGGFGVEVGLTIAAAKKGFRIIEVETMFRHRVTGTDVQANLHRARQLFDVVSALRG